MNPIRSSIAGHANSLHPLDSKYVKRDLQEFHKSMEKVRKMKPVTVYCVSWNVLDRDTEYYSTEAEAERNYSEHHSMINPVQAVQDEYGNILLVALKTAVKTKKIEVRDRELELRDERAELKKRKREIDEELEKIHAKSANVCPEVL